MPLPLPDAAAWALEGSTGAGVKVAIVDSGVDADHPRVGGIAGAVAFEPDDAEPSGFRVVTGPHEDLVGHGTACAGIIRSLAPDAEIYSVRVLGANLKGRGSLLRAGIAWAVEHGMAVANLSLSSRSPAMFGRLHEVTDAAYFGRTVLVSAANNVPGATYPSQYASVVSVAARARRGPAGDRDQPAPAGGVRCLRHRCRRRLGRPWVDRRHRQQFRGTTRERTGGPGRASTRTSRRTR